MIAHQSGASAVESVFLQRSGRRSSSGVAVHAHASSAAKRASSSQSASEQDRLVSAVRAQRESLVGAMLPAAPEGVMYQEAKAFVEAHDPLLAGVAF